MPQRWFNWPGAARFTIGSTSIKMSSPAANKTSLWCTDTNYEVKINDIQRYWADNLYTVLRGPTGTDAGSCKLHLNDSEVFLFGAGGTNGLKVTSTISEFTTIPQPDSDNGYALGAVGKRWAQLFAGTATINTSDVRKKRDFTEFPPALLDAWLKHVKFIGYRWNPDQKVGDQLHAGVIAQDVIAAFDEAGLDWRDWAVIFDGGEHGYSVRYDHVYAIEAAAIRRKIGV